MLDWVWLDKVVNGCKNLRLADCIDGRKGN